MPTAAWVPLDNLKPTDRFSKSLPPSVHTRTCNYVNDLQYGGKTTTDLRSLGLNNIRDCWLQWPRGRRSGSATARFLGLWVRVPPEAWMSVCCEWCVLSGRRLCVGLITRPKESHWVSECISCSLDNREALAHKGLTSYVGGRGDIHIRCMLNCAYRFSGFVQ